MFRRLAGNFAESSDSRDSYSPFAKVKGNLKLNVAFLEHIDASCFIRDTILDGYKIPCIYTPPSAYFSNNRSAFQHSDFVEEATSELLATGSLVECGSVPVVVNPLSVIQSLPLYSLIVRKGLFWIYGTPITLL